MILSNLKFAGQLWKLDEKGKLINKRNIWKSKKDDYWTLKPLGTMFYIKNKNKVLTIKNDTISYQRSVADDVAQLWEKGPVNDEGYFNLSNSQKVLTASDSGIKLEIKGKNTQICSKPGTVNNKKVLTKFHLACFF